MAKKDFSTVIKQLIEDKSKQVKNISNLPSSPALTATEEGLSRESTTEWFVYQASAFDFVSPDQIVQRVIAQGNFTPLIVTGTGGKVYYTPSRSGVFLFTTLIQTPSAITIPVEIRAKNCVVSAYADETLIRRRNDYLRVLVTLKAGLSPFNVVIQGQPNEIEITLPPDVTAAVAQYVPSAPQWRDTFPLETDYVDPKTGSSGIELFWYDQPAAGGWGVYKRTQQNYGQIKSVSVIDDFYIVIGNTLDSGVPIVPYLVASDSGIGDQDQTVLGHGVSFTIDSGTQELSLTVRRTPEMLDYTLFSGTGLFTVGFQKIAELDRTVTTNEIRTYVDTNVRKGTEYAYALDAFSPFDRSLRSARSTTKKAVAGDVTPPGSVVFQAVVEKAGTLTVYYHTPTDEDYLGTNLYYDNVNSGTVDLTLVDYGLPDKDDSLTFTPRPGETGDYYLVTFDRVGNEQYVYSGESFNWDGSETFPGGIDNLRPILKARQLSSTEVTAAGLNPYRWAILELDAEDDTVAHDSLEVDWRKAGDGDWTTVVGTDLPSGISLARSYQDNWLRARAYDGTLYSHEFTFVVDYDTNPEISDMHGEYIVDSGAVFITGAVDDDTKSLVWYVTAQYTGPTGSDPTPGSPTTIDDLDENKTFSFAVGLSDGQRKTIRVIPYSGLTATGSAGLLTQLDYSRPPRTTASVVERTIGGGVSRTTSLVTLKVVPETALTYIKIVPIDWGDVTGSTSSSISDSSKNWSDDQYNDDYDLWIVAGPGKGEKYQITDTVNSTQTVSISPSTFTTTPTTASDYYIAERYYLYIDSGTASSATASTLVDSSKTWLTNQFQNQKVRMLSGAAGVPGQERQIASSTGTTLTLTEDWTTTPSNGDAYEIFGPIAINKSPTIDKRLYFYSDVPGVVTEEEKSLILDADTLPEFESFSLTEVQTQVLRASVTGPDEDVKNWGFYLRRNYWPTLVGDTPSGTIDRTYGRYFGPTDLLEIDFDVATGTWYGVVIPYDSYNNSGPFLTDVAEITGTPPSPPPLLSNVIVTDQTGYSSNATHRISWDHNATCEDDVNITVTIKAKRSDWGTWDTLVTGRRADYDAATESNSISGEGSYDHTGIAHLKQKFVIWYYEVWLYDTGVYQTKYSTQISGYYSDEEPQ